MEFFNSANFSSFPHKAKSAEKHLNKVMVTKSDGYNS